MVDTTNLTQIKEYEKFILFKNNKTGIRECILKIDLIEPRLEEKPKIHPMNKWEREAYRKE